MDFDLSPFQQSDLSDAVTGLMAVLDLELRIQWANRAAGESVGEDPENLLGRYCYQVWLGRDTPCEQCPVQSTIRTGMYHKGEVESPDGKVFLIKNYPLRTPEGELKGITEVTLDITEYRRAEVSLRRQSEKQALLLESVPTQIWYLTDVETYGTVNQARADFCGLSREVVEYKKLWYILSEDEAWVCRDGNILVFQSGELICTEEWLHNASGEQRLVEIIKTPKLDANGKVEYVVCSGSDITERKRAEERVYSLTKFDNLTGLPNREFFLELLGQAVSRSKRFDECGAVLLMNIERLKSVNDTLGEQAGNELIREVGRRIWDTIREQDTVARVSGDEFMILAEGIETGEKARRLGLRVLERIGGELELSHRQFYPEASIGFTLFPHGASDPDSLIKQADMALSGAKKSANRIQQFAGDEEGISREFHLEQDLKSALANEEFQLFYQPQIDLQSGKIVGLEALIRWSHPQRGLVSPGEFIPLLERSGMIASVDAWVVRKVCEQLRSWRDEGFLVRASVNLSARDLGNDSIIGVISSTLEENRLPADALGVELTETELMENMDRASGILRTLSDWGIRVALDDFGKGYSCLSYLQRLDIHVIKIDKEFVAGMLENADSLTLVQTIIAMAHNLGKEVLAEGVEQREQWQKLLELGCDYGQGFLWGRPQPPDTLKVQEE
ncbi:MAG: EAL domain-containing protein [Desulfovermiculus sp.]|nr:EAL domain-containing protein [Desulfovermiculus sp.]